MHKKITTHFKGMWFIFVHVTCINKHWYFILYLTYCREVEKHGSTVFTNCTKRWYQTALHGMHGTIFSMLHEAYTHITKFLYCALKWKFGIYEDVRFTGKNILPVQRHCLPNIFLLKYQQVSHKFLKNIHRLVCCGDAVCFVCFTNFGFRTFKDTNSKLENALISMWHLHTSIWDKIN
jgi:hypothetical protein